MEDREKRQQILYTAEFEMHNLTLEKETEEAKKKLQLNSRFK
jgi:hypothetical protein